MGGGIIYEAVKYLTDHPPPPILTISLTVGAVGGFPVEKPESKNKNKSSSSFICSHNMKILHMGLGFFRVFFYTTD
jgi:hypothetical protein